MCKRVFPLLSCMFGLQGKRNSFSITFLSLFQHASCNNNCDGVSFICPCSVLSTFFLKVTDFFLKRALNSSVSFFSFSFFIRAASFCLTEKFLGGNELFFFHERLSTWNVIAFGCDALIKELVVHREIA